MPVGVRATVAIVARLAFMLVDAAGALVGGAAVRRWRSIAPDAITEPDPSGSEPSPPLTG